MICFATNHNFGEKTRTRCTPLQQEVSWSRLVFVQALITV